MGSEKEGSLKAVWHWIWVRTATTLDSTETIFFLPCMPELSMIAAGTADPGKKRWAGQDRPYGRSFSCLHRPPRQNRSAAKMVRLDSRFLESFLFVNRQQRIYTPSTLPLYGRKLSTAAQFPRRSK
jgi:hypothetical protein